MRYLIILLLLTSCHSESRISKRALKDMAKAEQRYNNHSDIDTVGAHYCNTKHPVKVGKGQVRYIKGDTVTHTDTVTNVEHSVDHDTVKVLRTITKVLYVHDTTVRTDTFENTRTQELQASEIKGLRQDNTNAWDAASKAKIQANKRMWVIFILIAVMVAYIIIKSPKPWLK